MIATLPTSLRRPAQPVLPGLAVVLCTTLLVIAVAALVYAGAGHLSGAPREVHFTPGDQATGAIVTELKGAQRSIRVQAYSFTSAPIAKALVEAKRRGVEVTAVLDKSNKTAQYSSADFLAHAGVPTFIDAAHAIAHNKIILVDDATVMTGSFNFSKAAQERNAENLLILRDRRLADEYEANFQKHLGHSEPYAGR